MPFIDGWKACAVPCTLPVIVAGRPILLIAPLMLATASLSDTPEATD
jgi:hypothetical protein